MKKVSYLLVFLFFVSLNIVYCNDVNMDYGKSHRLGFRSGVYFPSIKAKSMGLDFEAQFNAKIHQNVDSGPKFGLFFRQVSTAEETSTYVVVPLNFTFRFYPFSRTKDSTHGWFAPYAAVDGGYYFSLLLDSNLINDNTVVIPEGLGGFGGAAGIGLELGTFGIVSIPDFLWFVEAQYRYAHMTSRRNYDLQLDGFTVSFGCRM